MIRQKKGTDLVPSGRNIYPSKCLKNYVEKMSEKLIIQMGEENKRKEKQYNGNNNKATILQDFAVWPSTIYPSYSHANVNKIGISTLEHEKVYYFVFHHQIFIKNFLLCFILI